MTVHVLVVIDSLAVGGAETSLVQLLDPLRKREVATTVVTLFDRDGLAPLARESAASLLSIAGARNLRSRVAHLRDILRATTPDAVHTMLYRSDIAGQLAARAEAVPATSSVLSVPTVLRQDHQAGRARVRLAFEIGNLATRPVRRLHAVSHTVAELASQAMRRPIETFEVIYHPGNIGRVGRFSADRRRRARLQVGLRGFVLLAAARQDPEKGLMSLMQGFAIAAERSPSADWSLVIAGREGRESKALSAFAEAPRLRGRVLFTGHTDDIGDLLCAADVVSVPSLHEGLGLSAAESLSLGRPLIYSDLPAIREVVSHFPDSVTWSHRPGDPEGISRAIESAARTPALPTQTASPEPFDPERIADQFAEFYHRLAEG